MTQEPPLICIVGPTGVGKSEIAFEIAKKLGYEILSCDAFQVYEGLAVGTAQPLLEWQREVPHHLVGSRKPSDSWTAGDFSREASTILEERKKKRIGVILVGGAGFYLKSLLEGPPSGTAVDPKVREEVGEKVEAMGLAGAHEWLRKLDAPTAQRIHAHDRMRICRALEKALSPMGFTPKEFEPVFAKLYGIECGREELDCLIKLRCQKMWGEGLLEETQKLYAHPHSDSLPAWKAIGYLEALRYMKHEMTEEESLERIFRRTRQYAKRQWTWFRRQHKVQWVQRNLKEGHKALVEELIVKINDKKEK